MIGDSSPPLDHMADLDHDVIIVGAGPVGGHLGATLAEAGLSVLILEEHREVGKPFQCAGLVTPTAMNHVNLQHTILSDVWGARLHSPAGLAVEIGEPGLLRTHVVCRKLFDEGCVRQAIEAGATLWVDSRPTACTIDSNGVELTVDREGVEQKLRCKLLCGADGVHSWTRRHFRMGRPKEIMVGFQAEVTGYDGPQDRLDMFTGEAVAPGLFAWAIPNGDTHRIGVWVDPDRLDGRSCEMLYDTLITHPLWRARFADIRETARFCGPLACGLVKRIHKERVVLFGDAAGLCKPTTGGGIGPGFEQIHLLAKGLIEAVNADRCSDSQLKKICRPMAKMRKNQERARILRDLFVSTCDDEELEHNFTIFAKPSVISLINEVGDIEKPVSLGLRLLKDVPEFRGMAARATWALLIG
jgi:digeranylgeranylglycerophospholipid reductase